MNRCTCDKCNKDFEIKLKTSKLPKDIEKTYFKCSFCKEVFTAFYTDKEIRKLQSRQRVLTKDTTIEKCQEVYNEIRENKKKIKSLMDKIRFEAEGLND